MDCHICHYHRLVLGVFKITMSLERDTSIQNLRDIFGLYEYRVPCRYTPLV